MTTEYKRPRWVKKAMAAGGEFHAMKQDPRRHNLINLSASAGIGLVFCGLIALGSVVSPWVYIPVASVLFGCLFFAVNILVIHECSHNMFLLSSDRKRQKRLNRLAGRLASVPFFTDYIRHWEQGHTVHHLRPCDPDDPQDPDPLTGARLWRRYLMLCMPLAFMYYNPSRQYPGLAGRAGLGVLFWAPLVVLTVYAVGWWVPVALLLAFHTTVVLNWTKKAQEHGAGLAHEPDYILRSRTYFYPLAPLTSPFNINYHFEHHANFNVPWYALPRYHRRLLEIVPRELHGYYFHHEFFGQLSGRKVLPDRALLQDTAVMTPEAAG